MKSKLLIIGGISIIILFIAVFNGKNTPKLIKSKTLYSGICQNCNIIFVSFDTMRAKSVHFLGYEKNTTPTLDKIAKDGLVFNNAMSVTSWTLPSTMSWFTGMYPTRHKILNKFTVVDEQNEKISNLKDLSPDVQTLAEVLKQQGYQTGGFTGGAGVDHQFGFNQGFDTYTDAINFGGFKDSIPQALEWIKQHKNNKFFVFLHGYDIHGQYVPEGGYDHRFVNFDYRGKLTGSKEEQLSLREQGLDQGKIYLTRDDVRFLTALYDEKIQRADAQFAKFLADYTKMGLNNNTIFVITSDHGEEFYEHGRIDHGHSLYEELIHVPLIIYLPKLGQGKIIKNQVRSIDLMPTILDLAGIKHTDRLKNQMEGTSLTSIMAGDRSDELIGYSETDYRYATRQRAIKKEDSWKLIFDLELKTRELFNLNNDPGEQTDQSAKNRSKQEELYDLLRNLFNLQ